MRRRQEDGVSRRDAEGKEAAEMDAPFIDKISAAVVDEAIRIHRELGPGLFESVYEAILAGRLEALGLRVDRQLTLPVEFDGKIFEIGRASCRERV